MSAVMEIWNGIHGIVTSADVITLVMMAVIAIAAGFMMQGFGSLISTTVAALVVFGLALYVRGITQGGQNAAAYADTSWHHLLSWQVQGLLAYVVLFAVVIAIVQFVRSLVLR